MFQKTKNQSNKKEVKMFHVIKEGKLWVLNVTFWGGVKGKLTTKTKFHREKVFKLGKVRVEIVTEILNAGMFGFTIVKDDNFLYGICGNCFGLFFDVSIIL